MVMMAVGLLVIPILPGLVIIWVAALGYGIAAGFGTIGLDHVRAHFSADGGRVRSWITC